MVKRKDGTKTKMALTNGCTGQISAVTFFALRSKKAAIKNLLGEPGVILGCSIDVLSLSENKCKKDLLKYLKLSQL